MKEYFWRFITGKINVYRSFILHFVLVNILGQFLFLGLDNLFPKELPVQPVISFLLILLGITSVGAVWSALRTLNSGEERVFHKISSGLILILMTVIWFYVIKDIKNLFF